MMAKVPRDISLPTACQIRRAIDIYLAKAYGDRWPGKPAELLPPEGFDPAEYLMSDATERIGHGRRLRQVRSFAIRLGNSVYPNMKLKISRPPQLGTHFFSVDCHDAMLGAPGGSSDAEGLQQLKSHNAELAVAIEAAWDAVGLPTQKGLLRQRIRQAKEKGR